MSPRNAEELDPVAAGVTPAAEAAVLEARLRMLREALVAVDARTRAVSGTLRQLRRTASGGEFPSSAVENGNSPLCRP